MPLVLGLTRGQGFKAGEHEFVVSRIHKNGFELVKTNGNPGEESFEVVEEKATKLEDKIFVSKGLEKLSKHVVSVAIDAPRSIKINRIEAVNDRYPKISIDLVQRVHEDGPLGQTVNDCKAILEKACELAAPFTHEDGNYRYEDILLDIEDGVLLDVSFLVED